MAASNFSMFTFAMGYKGTKLMYQDNSIDCFPEIKNQLV